ncbi:NADH dehydrogenase [Monoraphidium neglectum]|uniref:NADH dehydrogenase n=1 Tax=Monoraphidium neglectum TaxID=145388 RepID=A0A0D2LNM2_9CHLO|nr:NADH dehydrogenase [Monoraphidium neglectum]KIZ07869.1 NADH dehydrogenase [Monoraphidium neglectum]|eukprot:XP_013906888.1 NADH dehydrogenase [Monoraphidium neglectum]
MPAHPRRNAIDRLVRQKDGKLKLRRQLDKPVVLVLGTGWGAQSLIKVIDTDLYEVICVSPRNHFIFTPMLPSTAVGTIEFRSLLEPIRNCNPFATYFEATCDAIDPDKKVARCTGAVAFRDGRRPEFEVEYDTLVVAVGEQPSTFGVPGVAEHAFFMKEITDAVKLRRRTQEVFELAALPGTSEEDRARLLHFVVVGGGPTGVEFAGAQAARAPWPGRFLLQPWTRFEADFHQLLGSFAIQSGHEFRSAIHPYPAVAAHSTAR